MMDADTIAILQEHVRRTSRSLLHYVDESYPWASAGEVEIVRKLKEMLHQEQAATRSLVEFLIKQPAGTPYLGSYPVHFTTMNFLSVDRLLALLVKHQQQDVTDLEHDLGGVTHPKGRELLEQLFATKKKNLATFVELLKETQTDDFTKECAAKSASAG